MHTTTHQEILIQVSIQKGLSFDMKNLESFASFKYMYVQNDTEDILNLCVGYDVKKV